MTLLLRIHRCYNFLDMPVKKIVFIGVIGGGEISPEDAARAEEVGREIARRGAALVCGGLGGVMEAACRGARAEGGHTIGAGVITKIIA